MNYLFSTVTIFLLLGFIHPIVTLAEINSNLTSNEMQQPSIEANVNNVYMNSTSRLGQIGNAGVKIYPELGKDLAITSGETYTNTTYYIKKEAVLNNQKYYLISKEPSSKTGVIGWVKSTDIKTYTHVGVDSTSKTFYVKGTYSAYSKAWGGLKDIVYKDLSKFKGYEFKVNLTEKVGNNIWYRGSLNGKTVWLHEAYISTEPVLVQSSTSRLGQISSTSVKIYPKLDSNLSVSAGDTYTNTVFYIKKEAVLDNQKYYLISKEPSSTTGVIGWVKSTDIKTYTHVGVDNMSKTFYVKGTYSAYSKAWGGLKDIVYKDLSQFKGYEFKVNLTEKVGNNIWYRGSLNGKTIWLHEAYVSTEPVPVQSSTSRLGQISNTSVKIYPKLDSNTPISAGETYTNTVFYIKKEAVLDNQKYYLISKKPSSTTGIIGWVKSTDIKTYPHVGVDNTSKTLYVKGTYSAYSKAWGGLKDIVYKDLSQFKGYEFKVNLTEKVGNNIWYRGSLNGKTVWLHEAYVSKEVEQSSTSRLGQINDTSVTISPTLGSNTPISAGEAYINTVFYIKKEAMFNGQKYYLISKEPSSTTGVIGWVKSTDIKTYPHVGVDSTSKTFYVKGTYSAYSKAWGGLKDVVYQDLSQYKGYEFKVTLTEKVGNNIWYRGVLNGKTVWLHEAYVVDKPLKHVISTYANYDISLAKMLDIQMAVNPQTDKKYKLWIREDALIISNGKGIVDGDNWNLRRGPGTNYTPGGKVSDGMILTLYDSARDVNGYLWYYVMDTSGWVTANDEDVKYYLDSFNFEGNLKDSLQFLDLSQSANINVDEVNEKILNQKGILSGKAQVFVDGATMHGVNEIYLISHALLETGNGGSSLANGIEVGKDSKGDIVLVNSTNRSSLNDIKTTYNMYGIGAKDVCPIECGAAYAYNAGWFTPDDAIIGGAEFIGSGYIDRGQNTLYKMRWNPDFAAKYKYASHQYATDIGWAHKQTYKMHQIYNLLDRYTMILEIPVYNN
ncbi:N-acetylglucosaminidase [Mesobacillus maritimus]|uniref:N-acetylglucosaminidase n=1 Tax=Mesobacillus maritimus TaxID=1643336 RepID=UPI00203CFA62|nr:N-acetylglucosaminidase [Mesobacillus maritimus]MCM3668095.1 N-acetylglucosaminidase [Mesobacillus maritimus]